MPPTTAAKSPRHIQGLGRAIVTRASIDECKEWADKAEALASYARMADDDELRTLADRIQANAVWRCGELLKEFDARGGDRSRKEGPLLFEDRPSQRQVAGAAGLSEHQRKQAVRVANVPREVFNFLVDSDDPPTVTALAEIGKQSMTAEQKAARQWWDTTPPRAISAATDAMGWCGGSPSSA
jgi:hypothetical protein